MHGVYCFCRNVKYKDINNLEEAVISFIKKIKKVGKDCGVCMKGSENNVEDAWVYREVMSLEEIAKKLDGNLVINDISNPYMPITQILLRSKDNENLLHLMYNEPKAIETNRSLFVWIQFSSLLKYSDIVIDAKSSVGVF